MPRDLFLFFATIHPNIGRHPETYPNDLCNWFMIINNKFQGLQAQFPSLNAKKSSKVPAFCNVKQTCKCV